MKDLDYNEDGVKIIDNDLIARLILKSRSSPRRRHNICLNTEKSDLIQRMAMALQPDSYIQAHKHENPDKRELFTIYQEELVIITYKENGDLLSKYHLTPKTLRTIELRPRIYHSLIAIKPDTVVFEMKDGPWESVEKDKTFAPWMPSEDSPEAEEYFNTLKERLGL